MDKTDIYEEFVRHKDKFILCDNCGSKRHFLTYKVGDISFKHYDICDCIDKIHKENYDKYKNVFFDSVRALCFGRCGYEHFTFKSFVADAEQTSAYGCIKDFCKKFLKNPANTKSVILSGGVGSGKTHLICAALNLLIEGVKPDETIKFRLERGMYEQARAEYSPYKYYFAPDLARRFCENYNRGEAGLTDKLISAPLIAIDDFGSEPTNENVISKLLYVIDGRIIAKKPVLISTNLLPDDILKKYGSRIYDRLKGMCEFKTISSKSHRNN